MRASLLTACLFFSVALFAEGQVSINKSPGGWELANGHIRVELTHSSDAVLMKSLRRDGGSEWAVPGKPIVAVPDKSASAYRYREDLISDLAKGGKQLTLRFQSEDGGLLSLELKLYPTGAVVQTAMQIENRGQNVLLLDPHINPLFLTLKNPAKGLKPYSSVKGQHGFHVAVGATPKRDFTDWLVLENEGAGESILIGGEPGLGVLGWRTEVRGAGAATEVEAGTILIKDKKAGPAATFELAPGATVETPISFFVLAKGDSDNAGNETFRYLKQYVFQAPLPDSPLVTYCIWLTEKNSEESASEGTEPGEANGIRCFLP